MKRTITALSTFLIALAASAGIPEEAEFIRTNYFTGIHGIFIGRLEEYAHERGFTSDDLLERLKYISETHWNSEDLWAHHGAECAISTMGMLRMSNAVSYLEEQLYRDELRQAKALRALQEILLYNEQFLDITEKAVSEGNLPRLKLVWALCDAIRGNSEPPLTPRIYRALLQYPPRQNNNGLDAEGYDDELCRHMKGYARSKERLEQVALLAANTNASPELREKYAKELEKMRAIPEDELICLLDLYPPTENELAQTRKDGIDKRANVSATDVETKETRDSATNTPPLVSTSAGHGDGHPVYSRPVVVLAAVAVGIVGALVFVRKRRGK